MMREKEKGPRRGGVLSWVLIALGCAGLVVAAVMLARTGLGYAEAQNEYAALRERYVAGTPAAEAETDVPAGATVVDVAALRALNPDCVGWIELPGAGIGYPVVQGADNSHYLTHTFEGTQNSAGAIFMDWRCGPAFTDGHTLLFGHNMRDGSMFSSLDAYLDADFLRQNPELYIHLEGEVQTWRVVLARQVAGDDALYGMVAGHGASATGDAGLAAAVAKQLGEGDFSAEDRFLTLSTCTSGGSREARNIVVAVYTGTP